MPPLSVKIQAPMFHFARESPGHWIAVYPNAGFSSHCLLPVSTKEESKIYETQQRLQLSWHLRQRSGGAKIIVQRTGGNSDTVLIRELWKLKWEAADSVFPRHWITHNCYQQCKHMQQGKDLSEAWTLTQNKLQHFHPVMPNSQCLLSLGKASWFI